MSFPRSFEGSSNVVLSCRNVGKEFYFHGRPTSMREQFIGLLSGASVRREPLFSLRDLSLSVSAGEGVALIGGNGSGKSTALRLMAGVYQPTRGSVVTKGSVATVIELGAGFNGELTGAENIELYAAILGISKSRLCEQRAGIVEFAELEHYIDVPVKFYSSGMYARLAFSVALCVEPDILLLDEVLSVGDQRFRHRCILRLGEFIRRGGALVTTSHNLDTVRDLCTRALWLEAGDVLAEGPVDNVIDSYLAAGQSR